MTPLPVCRQCGKKSDNPICMRCERAAGDELPTVTHEAVVKLGDLEITVLHLSNGERVIEEQSLNALMRALFGETA